MQLMDRSSLGRDYNAFKSLYTRIEKALQFVVNGIDVDWGNLTDEKIIFRNSTTQLDCIED